MTLTELLKQRAAGTRAEVPHHPRIAPLTVKLILSWRPTALCCVGADTAAADALRLMAQRDIDAVLIMDGGSLRGVFSERDYRRQVLRGNPSAQALTVGSAMTPCTMAASPEDSAEHCMKLMAEAKLRHLPIRGGPDLTDILSREELLASLADHYERIIRAFELDQQVMFLRGTYSC